MSCGNSLEEAWGKKVKPQGFGDDLRFLKPTWTELPSGCCRPNEIRWTPSED
jgi:hypothetical protein